MKSLIHVSETALVATCAAGALVVQLLADTELPQIPQIDFGNMTATAILGWYAWHTTTRTIPQIVADFRHEQQELRETFRQELEIQRAGHETEMQRQRDSHRLDMDRERETRRQEIQELRVARQLPDKSQFAGRPTE